MYAFSALKIKSAGVSSLKMKKNIQLKLNLLNLALS